MNILALEFSSPVRSVAVASNGIVLGQASEQAGRETHAFALIDEALRQAALPRRQVECIAVGTGPGSYAGIRIAIAIAQGWHLARGVKLAAVSSADAVAAQAYERGWRGTLQTVIDAQRQELFGAEYELGPAGWRIRRSFVRLEDGGPGGPGSSVVSRPKKDSAGVAEFRVRMDLAGDSMQDCLLPAAAALARLAASAPLVSAADLAPIYLRKAEFVKAPPPRIKHE